MKAVPLAFRVTVTQRSKGRSSSCLLCVRPSEVPCTIHVFVLHCRGQQAHLSMSTRPVHGRLRVHLDLDGWHLHSRVRHAYFPALLHHVHSSSQWGRTGGQVAAGRADRVEGSPGAAPACPASHATIRCMSMSMLMVSQHYRRQHIAHARSKPCLVGSRTASHLRPDSKKRQLLADWPALTGV